jgi:hypothetical protein
LTFTELPVATIRSEGLQLPAGMARSGIYLLEFANGDRYLGQSRDLVLRIGGHRRTWNDITSLGVLPVAESDLDAAYLDAERRFGRLTRSPLEPDKPRRGRPEPFDPFLARIAWIEAYLGEDETRRPPDDPDQRERTRPLFERLCVHPQFEQLRSVISLYLERVVPAPPATERRNWVITSLPSTCRTKVWHRLICLSINNVEALTIGEQFDGSRWHVCGFMSAAATDRSDRRLLPAAARRGGAYLAPAYYKTVGDVTQIGFDSLDAVGPLLGSDDVLDLVGELAMRLMRRGRGMYGRFHDYNLADAVLGVPSASRRDVRG